MQEQIGQKETKIQELKQKNEEMNTQVQELVDSLKIMKYI